MASMIIHRILHYVLVTLVIFMLCMEIVSSSGSESVFGNSSRIMKKRCIDKERKALFEFKRGLVDTYGALSSWESTLDCCQWRRVGCDNHTGHVTHLDLSALDFFSWTPSSIRISNISSSLLDLKNLNYLDLNFNNFRGLPIPKFIGSLTNLVYLDLSEANFGKAIPDELRNLSKLNHLDLRYNSFDTSTIPNFISSFTSLIYLDLSENHFSGAIPHQFGNLSKLNHLDLRFNQFDTSTIPKFISSFTSLTYLDLAVNYFSGAIPHQFGNLSKLNYLDLSGNQLHGVIPDSFHNLSSLEYIRFSSNNFTGNLQDLLNLFPEDNLQTLLLNENQITGSLLDITRFSSLKELRVGSNKLNGYLPKHFKQNSVLELLELSDNSLTGSLPDFTGCSSLRSLLLGRNQFTKWETQSTGQLTKLDTLDLSMNSISSTISERHLTNLSSLLDIDLSYNPLTFNLSSEWLPPFQLSTLSLASCKLGPKFPSWIRNQKKLHSIDFSNSQISDTIPMWFWNVSSRVRFLNISSNKIRGKFSSKHFNFESIDLSSNYFEGAVPVISSRCYKINLSQNKFSGTLFSLPVVEDMSLAFLDLSHNSLFGSLPNTWVYFKDLAFLNLGYNNFGGRIPTSMGDLVSLQMLILRRNHLYGELPASLRNCSKLGFVDFGLNKISGKIPAWIGDDLQQLYALILRSNQFYGSMPYQLCHLSELHFLDLSLNRISGTVPQCFGNLTAMIKNRIQITEHYYDYNNANRLPPRSSFVDNALVDWKGQEFEYGRNFAYLKMIDLSSNQLTGEIPIGIMRLLDIKGLNLSKNKFYGKIPLDIGQLKMLECLDLSINKFAGNIPQSMSGLHFLAYLDLSNNNFSGRIPSGTQLQGFNSSAYAGNLGLCGSPLIKKCPGDEDEAADAVYPTSIENEIDDDEIKYRRWLYISAVLGFSTTFWGICGSLLLNRRWRHAYFLFLNNLKDQIYLVMVLRIPRMRRWI